MPFVADIVFYSDNHSMQFACTAGFYFFIQRIRLFQRLFGKNLEEGVQMFLLIDSFEKKLNGLPEGNCSGCQFFLEKSKRLL